ncbi:MAG: adenylate/guanylate cyclase domain-containing protein, partial [Thiohalocapsa sp.]
RRPRYPLQSADSIIAQGIHASLCVPLIAREAVAGVLYVDNLSLSAVYSEEDAEFVSTIANQIAIALDNARLFEQMRQEAIYSSKLARFFPEPVGRRLREDDGLAVINTEVTALFCDISGFTELCAWLAPEQIIAMLNRYFQIMVEDIVFPHQGTLEKYIGDALLAIWGAPYRGADDADRAVSAAVAMQQAVGPFNVEWTAAGHDPITIHIGLSTGQVAAGNIGSERLVQYAAIGDTTNVASRICDLAAPGEVLLSAETVAALGDQLWPLVNLGPVSVKGKCKPLHLYRLDWRSG